MSAQPTPQRDTTPQKTPPLGDQPAASNRAARRRKGKSADPASDSAAATVSYRGSAGQPGPARTTAQGRRIIPVRRTG